MITTGDHPTLEQHKQDTKQELGETLSGATDIVHASLEMAQAVKETTQHAAHAAGSAAATGGHYVATKAHDVAHKATHSVAETIGLLIGSLVNSIDKLNVIADRQHEVVAAQLNAFFHKNPEARETLRTVLAVNPNFENTSLLIRAIGKAIGSVEAVVEQTGVLDVADHIGSNMIDGYQQGRRSAVHQLATAAWQVSSFSPDSQFSHSIGSEPEVIETRSELTFRRKD